MKILIVRNSPDKVNFTNVTYNRQETGLARAFNCKGHQCDLVYFGGDKENIIELEYAPGKTYKVYMLKGRSFLKNAIYDDFDSIIKNYDIIQSGGYDQIESWLLSKKYSKKMTIYNGTYYSSFNKNYNIKVRIIDALFIPRYKKNNVFFVTKNELSADFLRKKGLNNVTTIGVGLDLNLLSVKEDYESEFSLELDKYSDYGLLLYVGKLEPRRNVPFLISTFSEVKKINPKTKLVIVGRGKEEYIESIFNFAREKGVYNDILWCEGLEQKYLKRIYKSCDVFLLPTLYEIFGMVLLEAMYFELPIVTSLNGGSDILIKNRGTGYIIDEFSERCWAEKIIEILDNPIHSREVGTRARQYIEENFTWDTLADKFLNVYKKRLEMKDQD